MSVWGDARGVAAAKAARKAAMMMKDFMVVAAGLLDLCKG
jgi:hypothetical protein